MIKLRYILLTPALYVIMCPQMVLASERPRGISFSLPAASPFAGGPMRLEVADAALQSVKEVAGAVGNLRNIQVSINGGGISVASEEEAKQARAEARSGIAPITFAFSERTAAVLEGFPQTAKGVIPERIAINVGEVALSESTRKTLDNLNNLKIVPNEVTLNVNPQPLHVQIPDENLARLREVGHGLMSDAGRICIGTALGASAAYRFMSEPSITAAAGIPVGLWIVGTPLERMRRQAQESINKSLEYGQAGMRTTWHYCNVAALCGFVLTDNCVQAYNDSRPLQSLKNLVSKANCCHSRRKQREE